jgi:hypothetical protein
LAIPEPSSKIPVFLVAVNKSPFLIKTAQIGLIAAKFVQDLIYGVRIYWNFPQGR